MKIEKNYKIKIYSILLFFNLFVCCRITPDIVFGDTNDIKRTDGANRKWTILVYMAADNNLESDAIDDIAEMERSFLNTADITVLMLVDRNPSYDASNGNWTGTKLYRLKTGKKEISRSIISDEINCKDLNLLAGQNTELDMSSEYVLSTVLQYAQKKFPSDYIGLIVWGHGSGWRCECSEESKNSNQELCSFQKKGFAFDDTSNVYMSLKQLKNGISEAVCQNQKKLDFLGFDTCFGAEIEVFYELKDLTNFAVGSEGLILSSGWDYEMLFNDFQSKEMKKPQELCESVVYQFGRTYLARENASILAVDMSKMQEYFEKFENFMHQSSEGIDSAKVRDELIQSIYKNCEKHTYGTAGSDVYLDINSLVEVVCDAMKQNGVELLQEKNDFELLNNDAIISCWGSEKTECSLGVYFATLAEGGIFDSSHPSGYINGKNLNQIDFVTDSRWYVPEKQTGNSFLDKLFYFTNWNCE